MEEQSIDTNRRYMLSGDLTLHALMSATAAYFNKNMFETINGDIAQLYELVDNGTWTFDKFLEYCEGAYSDVNGDGLRDEDDVYGARHTSNFHAINYVSLSSGLNMHGRDENGLPVLDVYNENWINWMDYIKAYMTDTYSKVSAQPNQKYTEDYFVNEKSMFSMGMLYDAAKLRDSEFDYGIVPFPKFSEDVEYKSSGATPNADAILIPVTTDPALYECIGAALEALCAESYRNVTELYYETTLKGKYLGSENDIRMVDIIYKNLGTNFVMVAGEVLGGGAISSMYTYAYQNNDCNLTSYYDANKVKFEGLMEEMLEKYYALG